MDPDILSRILKEIRSSGSAFKNSSYFNRTACGLFQYQFRNNPVYRDYCLRTGAGINPEKWQDIPFIPIHAFKKFPVRAVYPKGGLRFLSSGTTLGSTRSCHLMKNSIFYDAAIDRLVGSRFASYSKNTNFVSLIKDYSENPDSSLSYMVSRTCKMMKFRHKFFAFSGGEFRYEKLTRVLSGYADEGMKVFIMTTTLGLIDYCRWLKSRGFTIQLPKNSLIMDTGGYKGRFMNVTRSQILKNAAYYLGVSSDNVVNEYGMTELSSQFYDARGTDIKPIPSWCRVAVLNPRTLRMNESSGKGLLRIADLANVWSFAFIQTEDVVRLQSGGFRVLGRAEGSGLRGCSMDYENK